MDPRDYAETANVRRTGLFMIIAGWAFAIALLTWFFSTKIERKVNPNPTSVLDQQTGSLVLHANQNGMYVATGRLNGLEVDFLLDTGATWIAVPLDVARIAGMELGGREEIATANGTTVGWRSKVDRITIGPLNIENENAIVLEDLQGQVLLGMNVLQDQVIIQSGGKLLLHPAP